MTIKDIHYISYLGMYVSGNKIQYKLLVKFYSVTFTLVTCNKGHSLNFFIADIFRTLTL